MSKILFIVFGLTFNTLIISAEANNDTINLLANDLIKQLNDLPLTKIEGHIDNKFQSKYLVKWNRKKQILIFKEKRFNPNSKNKLTDEFLIEIKIESLHPKGILLQDFNNDSSLSFQLFTAQNLKKIKTIHRINGKATFGMYYDRFTIGSWDSLEYFIQLQKIKKLIVQIVKLKTKWNDKDIPDFLLNIKPEPIKQPNTKLFYIEYEQNDESPLYENSTLEEFALFLDANNEKENIEKIESYFFEEIDNIDISFKGRLSGSIIVSESGKVEDFISFNMNNPKTEKKAKEIFMSMPNWKAGKYKGKNVRTTTTIMITK